MDTDRRLAVARQLMNDFSSRTGLSDSAVKPCRYLWTDAFAVCNFLELHRLTGDSRYIKQALWLVDQTHHILGRHRDDDPRSGWLSGLDEAEGEKHPTAGGLRIGKTMPERRPDEPYSPQLEWERDGQYFHYLTKWMHALIRVARETSEPHYHLWAVELAIAVHPRFTHAERGEGAKRMFWKMSIDLSRPQVMSMGMHDPLDGFLTYIELRTESQHGSTEEIDAAIDDMKEMCRGRDWNTDDPLGIGGLLTDLLRTGQLMAKHGIKLVRLFDDLLDAAASGLKKYAMGSSLEYPREYRLAFRELGLSIGLHAVERLSSLSGENPSVFGSSDQFETGLNRLLAHIDLCEKIESFWLNEENRKNVTWREHENINCVMLATSLVPDGFL